MHEAYLARFVLDRALPAEPVATGLLAHVLQQSEEARAAFHRWLDALVPGMPSGISWSAEAVEAESGRPDVVGSDASGARVLIEGKFDADFTSTQLDGSYLGRLAAGQPGLYLLVAPEDRVTALFAELVSSHGLGAVGSSDSGSSLLVPGPDGRFLGATSWQDLVGRLQGSCTDSGTLSDLEQLRGLVELVVQTQWLPLGVEDLSWRQGRQVSAVISATLEAAGGFRARGWKVTTGTSDHSPGRFLTSPDGVQLWVGVWFSQWARFSSSPVWVDVKEQQGLTLEAIRSALAAQGSTVKAGPSGGITYPIHLPTGASRVGVTEAVSRGVQQVYSALRSARDGD